MLVLSHSAGFLEVIVRGLAELLDGMALRCSFDPRQVLVGIIEPELGGRLDEAAGSTTIGEEKTGNSVASAVKEQR